MRVLETLEGLLPFGRRGANQPGAEATGVDPAAEQAQPEYDRARDPDGDHTRQQGWRDGVIHGVWKRCSRRRGCGQYGGGKRFEEGCRDRLGGRRAQQLPGDDRRGGHDGERGAGEQVVYVRAGGSRRPLSYGSIEGGDQDALPEKMEQRPAETFDPGLGREKVDCTHLGPRFLVSSASIIRRISARSSADVGCAPSAPMIRLLAEPPKTRLSRSAAIRSCM